MGLVISVMKIKDALGYRQHIRLFWPDLRDWLNKEKEDLFVPWSRWGAKSLLEPSNLDIEQEPLGSFAGLRRQPDMLSYFYLFHLCNSVKLAEVPVIVFLEDLVIVNLC